jgi:hypothetical protein
MPDEKRKTWVEMDNGKVRTDIPFVAWVNTPNGETRLEFTAPNPPIYHGDPNLFSRLSFETIVERFKEWGFHVSHIVRGECSESGSSGCYVFSGNGQRVPYAVIRPAVFARDL